MAKLIGTDPNQVPTNADLGTMAYQDYDQLAPSFYAGRKNLLLNSNFTISQRGSWTSATSVGSGEYTLDRWVTTIGTVTATLQTRQNQTLPNGENVNTLRMVCTSGGSGYIQIRQLFDKDIGQFCRNQPVTFSVWMRTTKTDHNTFGPSILNPNVSWQTYGGPIIADGEWHLYKKTTTISNSAGTTAGDMAVAIQNNNTWVTGEEFEIALPQFEIGTSRSEFVHRPVHEELAACQRYYTRIGNDDGAFTHLMIGAAEGAGTYVLSRTLPTGMRALPSVTIGSGVNAFTASAGAVTVNSFSTRCTRDILCISANVSGTATLGQAAVLYDAGDNGYIECDAEL